ncbi:hypothetical protein GAN52_02050 [Escherichia coli]|nr:hypothetical protein [Escherichia coli]
MVISAAGNHFVAALEEHFYHRFRDEGPSVKATQIGFGQLSRAQQVLGIGYLYVEAQLRQI